MIGMKNFLSALAAPALASASLYGYLNQNHTCVIQEPFRSCSTPTLAANASKVFDGCCVEIFGGQSDISL